MNRAKRFFFVPATLMSWSLPSISSAPRDLHIGRSRWAMGGGSFAGCRSDSWRAAGSKSEFQRDRLWRLAHGMSEVPHDRMDKA